MPINSPNGKRMPVAKKMGTGVVTAVGASVNFREDVTLKIRVSKISSKIVARHMMKSPTTVRHVTAPRSFILFACLG
jgi:hypothetical protein